MNAKLLISLALATLVAAFVSACSPDAQKEEMPAVNDENCKPESIAKIKENGTREQFQERCVRGSGQFKPSPKKKW